MKKKELEALKITELRSLAHKNGVSLRRNWSKAEIVTAIIRMTGPKRGRKPKPLVKSSTAASKKKQKKTALKKSPKKLKTGNLKKTSSTTASKSINTKKRETEKHVTRTNPLKNRITLMVRDASTLFAYWSISNIRAKQTDIKEWRYLNLRLYDLLAGENSGTGRDYYDIPVTDRVGNRYIEMRLPGHRFICEIGVITDKGEFLALARSKEIETPPDRLSGFPAEAESFYRESFGLYQDEELRLKDIYLTFASSK